MRRATSAAVVCVAVFHASTAGGAVAGSVPDDPLAASRHRAEWVEVRPAPIPAGLPLLKTRRGAAAATTVPAVDRPALRSLLVNRRFQQLTATLERFQVAFEKDPSREEWLHDAYDVLGQPTEPERLLIEKWVARTPRSFAPYLARAAYWKRRGFLWRGGGAAAETSRAELQAMQEAFGHARADLRKALALRPGLIEARSMLVSVEVASGNRAAARRAMEEAVARCPSCFHVRAEWLWALEPRWGGSLAEMEAFAARADPASPRQRNLAGLVLVERARQAREAGKRDEALSFLDRACSLGGEWTFLVERADARGTADLDAYLRDLDQADAVQPGLSDVLSRRAAALTRAARWEEAGRDLLIVLRSRPTSIIGNRLHPQVVRALDALAWKQHDAGQDAVAERLYDLAVALAPADRELQGHAAAVRRARAGGGAPRRDPPSPVSGDASPALRLAVVDREGRPVPGALVVAAAGQGGWEQLKEMMGAAGTSSRRADAGGEVVLPAGVGPWVVMAFRPREPLSGAAAVVPVSTTGAALRLVVGGAERVAGRARWMPPAGPPSGFAGAEVSLVPFPGLEPGAARSVAAARTGSDGAFVVEDVDAGRYVAFARGRGPRGPVSARQIHTRGGEATLSVLLTEERVLRGRVLVSGPGGGTPASRFTVTGVAFGTREFTSTDGRFSIDVANAYARTAVAFSVAGRPAVVRSLGLLEPDNDVGDVVVGPGRTLRGRVVDPLGAPVRRARVAVAETDDFLGWTAADGGFEVSIADGRFRIEVQQERWVPLEREIAADESWVELRMSSGGRLGILVPDAAGAPVAGVSFTMSSSDGRLRGCVTDANGRCEIAGLTPGEYRLLSRGRPEREPNAAPRPVLQVPVATGAEVGVRVPWVQERTRLTVNVTEPAQPPSPPRSPAHGRLFPGSPSVADVMDASGAARAPNYPFVAGVPIDWLPPGRYTAVVHRSAPAACAVGVVEVRPGAEETAALSLASGACR